MSLMDAISRTPASSERFLEKQFLQSQERTASVGDVAAERKSILDQMNQAKRARAFSSYESTIIQFYEDIIAALQRRVHEYEQLLAAQKPALSEAEPDYAVEETIKPSDRMLAKLKGRRALGR
jgi:hypothetical protein